MALMNTFYGNGKYPGFYLNRNNYKELYANLMQGFGGFPRVGMNPELARAQLGIRPPMMSPLSTPSSGGGNLTIPSPKLKRTLSQSTTESGGDDKEKCKVKTPSKTNFIPVTNFSIEGILGKRDRTPSSNSESDDDDDEEDDDDDDIDVADKEDTCLPKETLDRLENAEMNSDEKDNIDESEFSWLQCTRYKPPKLPRTRKREGVKKRKLGRNPRVPFTQQQVGILEQKFRQTHYLSSVDVLELSTALNLTETRVKIWFQNRRARERRDRECKKTNPHTRPSQSSTSTVTSSLSPYQTALPWPLPLPPNPAALAQFSQALQYGPSAFTPVPFIYTSQPPMTSTLPFAFYRTPESKD